MLFSTLKNLYPPRAIFFSLREPKIFREIENWLMYSFMDAEYNVYFAISKTRVLGPLHFTKK